MSVLRGIKDRFNPYVQINKNVFEDPNLSLKAKGLIGYCLSKPNHWKFYISHMSTVLKEKEKALYNIINECVEQGYAYRIQFRKKSGVFTEIETIVSDSKEEIQKIKEELSNVKCAEELKKFLPDRPFGDAGNRDADKEALVINDKVKKDIKEKRRRGAAVSSEKKEEQIKPPPKKVIPKESDKPKFHPALEKLDINWGDKNYISKNFDAFEIEKAVEWLTHPKTVIKTTLIKALMWACENAENLNIPTTEAELQEENKKYAADVYVMLLIPPGFYYEVLSKEIEIGSTTSQSQPTVIKYNDLRFKEKLYEALKKNRIFFKKE